MFPRNLQEAIEFYERSGGHAVSLTHHPSDLRCGTWDVVYQTPAEIRPITVKGTIKL